VYISKVIDIATTFV